MVNKFFVHAQKYFLKEFWWNLNLFLYNREVAEFTNLKHLISL